MEILKKKMIAISIFVNKIKRPYHIYTLKQIFEKYVDLLLIANIENSYV